MQIEYWGYNLIFRLYFYLLAIFFSNIAFAQLSPFEVSPEKVVLAEDGLEFKTFNSMKRESKSMPGVVRVWEGQSGSKVDGYSPNDLWRSYQLIGTWRNKYLELSVMKIKYPLPNGIIKISSKYSDVTLNNFNSWAKKNEGNIFDLELTDWLSLYFFDKRVPFEKKTLYTAKYPTVLYTRKGTPNLFFYYIRSLSDSSDQFIFLISVDPRVRNFGAKNIQPIMQSLKIKYVANKKEDKMLVVNNYHTGVSTGNINTNRKELAIKSISGVPNWNYVEFRDYLILTDINSKLILSKIVPYLIKNEKIYKKLFPLKLKQKTKVLRVFSKSADYKSYVGPQLEWSCGLWSSSKDELVMYYSGEQSKWNTFLETLRHEGFHQFLSYQLNPVVAPAWFNEGFATYFEGLKYKGFSAFNVQATGRIRKLKAFFLKNKKRPFMKELLSKSYSQFYDEKHLDDNYPLAWGLTFFLMKGCKVMNMQKYYGVLNRFYSTLGKTSSINKATEAAWGGINLTEFEKDFSNFIGCDYYIKKANATYARKL